jgi:hypothetical protein
MDQNPQQSGVTVPLDTFRPEVAGAVVTVLRRHGVAAWMRATGGSLPGLDDGEAVVLVERGRRDDAVQLLVAHMEEVGEAAAAEPRPLRHRRMTAPRHPMEDEPGPPIVMERFRRMGLAVAVVLAPLLVVTLATPRLPRGYVVLVFLAGLVALVWWRDRRGGPAYPDDRSS